MLKIFLVLLLLVSFSGMTPAYADETQILTPEIESEIELTNELIGNPFENIDASSPPSIFQIEDLDFQTDQEELQVVSFQLGNF